MTTFVCISLTFAVLSCLGIFGGMVVSQSYNRDTISLGQNVAGLSIYLLAGSVAASALGLIWS